VYNVSPVVYLLKKMFQPIKNHYQGVNTFIYENIFNRWTSVVNFMSQLL